jgi:hypothetical protein
MSKAENQRSRLLIRGDATLSLTRHGLVGILQWMGVKPWHASTMAGWLISF